MSNQQGQPSVHLEECVLLTTRFIVQALLQQYIRNNGSMHLPTV